MKIKTRWLILAVFLAICGVFLFGWCSGRRNGKSAANSVILAKSDTILQYKVKVRGLEYNVAQGTQIILTQKQSIAEGIIEKEMLRKLHLKTVNELTKANFTITILEDSVAHTGKIVVVHDTIGNTKNCLELPFDFSRVNKYLFLSGGFDKNGVMDFTLSIPAQLDVYTGLEKGSKNPVVVVTSKNPYLKITGIESVRMDLPKIRKWGIGLQAGYGVNTSFRVLPYVGVGIHYNILSF